MSVRGRKAVAATSCGKRTLTDARYAILMETAYAREAAGNPLRKMHRWEARTFLMGPPAMLVAVSVLWFLIFASKPTFLSGYYHPLAALKQQCADYPTCPFPAEAIATLYVAQTIVALVSLAVLYVYTWVRFDYRRALWPHLLVPAFWLILFADFYFGLFDDGAERSASNSVAHSPWGALHFALMYSLCWIFTVVLCATRLVTAER
jgi:hypothetical protein